MFIKPSTYSARLARPRDTLHRHVAFAVTLAILASGATPPRIVAAAPGICDWFPSWPACL